MNSMVDILTDYSVDDTPNIMDVKTELISPISSSTNSYKQTFRLDTAAYLDANTLLLFKGVAKDANTSADDVRFNSATGCLGAIDRVQFRIGGYVIQNLSNAGLWAALNVLYKERPDKQQKYWSHYFGNCLYSKVAGHTGDSDLAKGSDAGKNATTGSFVIDSAKNGFDYGAAADGAGAKSNNSKITNTADNNMLNAVPLSVIIPALNNKSLPLFLFEDYKVYIDIFFSQRASEYANKASTGGGGGAANADIACNDGDIVFQDVQMLVDYLILPSQVQEGVREETRKEGGYDLEFMNIVNVKKRIADATANVTQREQHRINSENQEVHSVQMTRKFETPQGKNSNKVWLGQRCDSCSVESVQYVVNGVEVYPEPYASPISQYNQISDTLSGDLEVVKPLYVNDINTQYSLAAAPESGLQGKFKPLGLSLRNGNGGVRFSGKQIGNYPIIVRYTRRPHAAVNVNALGGGNSDIALAENGAMDVNYFVGMTRLAKVTEQPSGMMVQVVN